jgi:hypothetical protein
MHLCHDLFKVLDSLHLHAGIFCSNFHLFESQPCRSKAFTRVQSAINTLRKLVCTALCVCIMVFLFLEICLVSPTAVSCQVTGEKTFCIYLLVRALSIRAIWFSIEDSGIKRCCQQMFWLVFPKVMSWFIIYYKGTFQFL